MKEWFIEFWTSKAMFSRTMKGLLIFCAFVAYKGGFGTLPVGWSGEMIPAVMMAIGVAWPAGENNPKPPVGGGGVS